MTQTSLENLAKWIISIKIKVGQTNENQNEGIGHPDDSSRYVTSVERQDMENYSVGSIRLCPVGHVVLQGTNANTVRI